MKDYSTYIARLGALVSGCLLAMAYPPFSDGSVAWIALVPLLLAIPVLSKRDAWCFGWLGGFLFYLFSLSWLLRLGVTGAPWPLAVIGWLLLAAYCGIYWGVFAWLWRQVWKRVPADVRGYEDADASQRVCDATLPTLGRLLLAPVLWVGLEYLRGVLFSGFPWNLLGISQFRNLAVIQVAAFGGVYAVSAVVMLMNAGVALTARRIWQASRAGGKRRRFHLELMLSLTVCAVVWIKGADYARRSPDDTRGEYRLMAVVQPNIVQRRKWVADDSNAIYQELERQTRLALLLNPALIVWPETAVPALLPDRDIESWIERTFSLRMPLLAGALERGTGSDESSLYNSSFMITPDKGITGVYRKQHLVPFGEYLPFENIFPFLTRLAPLGFSCRPGKEVVTLALPDGTLCGPLICFEDALPYLARRARRAGAQFLVNQTNDGWFDGSSGAEQHLAHAVFRSVEHRLGMLRAANTGVSAFIDPAGRVTAIESGGKERRTGFAGFAGSGVWVCDANAPQTMYTRYGDILWAVPCMLLTLIWAAVSLFLQWRNYRDFCFSV